MNLFYSATVGNAKRTPVQVGDQVTVNEGGANVAHVIFGINEASGQVLVRANDEGEGHEVEADAIGAVWQ